VLSQVCTLHSSTWKWLGYLIKHLGKCLADIFTRIKWILTSYHFKNPKNLCMQYIWCHQRYTWRCYCIAGKFKTNWWYSLFIELFRDRKKLFSTKKVSNWSWNRLWFCFKSSWCCFPFMWLLTAAIPMLFTLNKFLYNLQLPLLSFYHAATTEQNMAHLTQLQESNIF